MTPSGIEPATFRFVAQHLNHCATAVPEREKVKTKLALEQDTNAQRGSRYTALLLL